MLESTVDTEIPEIQKGRECSRCEKVADKEQVIWSIKIDEELGRVDVCQECWKTLNDIYRNISLARDAFMRMVYEHPGHEKIVPFVAGHVVMTVRRSRDEELAKFNWDKPWPTDVLVLSSGAIIIPAADEEWNDVGALCGIDNEGKTFEF